LGGCASQLKRELSPWLEFGLIPANLSSFQREICIYFLKLFKRRRDSPLPKLRPRSFPVHESNGTSGCGTLLSTGNFRLAKKGECNPTRLTEGVISSLRANPRNRL
jgi:hypothetical protein